MNGKFELKLLSLAFGVIFSALSSGSALAESFHCKFASAANAHFTPSEFDVVVDEADQGVVIRDRQFDDLTDGPMFGEVVTSNRVRRTLVWHSPMISSSYYPTSYRRDFRLEFRLTLRRDNSSAILTYAALGFGGYSSSEIFDRAEGKCTAKK
jgi:hypothetical protein